MVRLRTVLTLLLVLVAALPGLAQPQKQSAPYRMKPEDIIRLQVFDETQIAAELVITPDGNITAPFVGLVRAAGKTTTELEQDLFDLYQTKLRLRRPIVSIALVRLRPLRATITGPLERPNTYDMRPGDRVLNLVSIAGTVGQGADLRRAKFRRRDWNEWIPLDLRALVLEGNPTQNYELEDGDVISIPTQEGSFIRVLGEVRSPGPQGFTEGMRLIDAITLANGEIQNRSRLSRVLVLRQKQGSENEFVRIQCDIVAFVRKGDSAQNIRLQQGDIIFVPNNGNFNFEVLGAISNAVFVLDRFGIDLFGGR